MEKSPCFTGVVLFLLVTYLIKGSAASTPLLGGYRDFMRGLEYFQRSECLPALDAFRQAATADSEFIPAVVWASYSARNGRIEPAGDSIAAVATRLLSATAGRLSPLERSMLLRVSSIADSSAAVEEEAIRQAARLAPGSSFSYELGALLADRFRYREAVEAFEEVDRKRGWARGWLEHSEQETEALHLLGEDRRALALAQEAVAMDATSTIGYVLSTMALAEMGRVEDVHKILNQADEAALRCCRWGKLYWVFLYAVGELWEHGHQAEGDAVFRRAEAWYAKHPQFMKPEGLAPLAFQAHRWQEADSLYRIVLALGAGGDLDAAGAWSVVLVNRGRVAEADSLQRVWFGDRSGDRRTRATKAYLRAQLAAAKGDADAAVGFLRECLGEGGVDSRTYSHGPGWDPIRTARVYQEFIRPR